MVDLFVGDSSGWHGLAVVLLLLLLLAAFFHRIGDRDNLKIGNPWLLTMNLGLPVHFPFNQSIKLFSLFFGGSFFVGDSSGWHGLAVVVL